VAGDIGVEDRSAVCWKKDPVAVPFHLIISHFA